jgi:uncharacterized SAM-binding protein YcdF (DUF218 family)
MTDKINIPQGYKPFLASDPEYLKKITELIPPREEEAIKFELLTDVLECVQIKTSPYSFVKLHETDTASVQKIIDDSFAKLQTETHPKCTEKLGQLWDFLAESDNLKAAEVTFVFGGPETKRAEKAIELYKEGVAKKILFTGRKSSFMPDVEISEAEFYADMAKQAGVNTADIILETLAVNTPENAVNSIKLLSEMDLQPKSFILVTAEYHMRRAYLTFKAALTWEAELIRTTVPFANHNRSNYHTIKEAWSYVFNEYLKMYGARLQKHM